MIKPELGIVLLFVKNPSMSATFYAHLFDIKPIEQSPTFAMFALSNGVMLGLWSRYMAEPLVATEPGAAEICFSVDDVDAAYENLGTQGLTILQKPTNMDFGRTFVALDPDGHRIRIYKLQGQE